MKNIITEKTKKEINELSTIDFLEKYKDVKVYEKTQLKRDLFFIGNNEPFIDLPEDYYEVIPSDYIVSSSVCYPVFEEDTLIKNAQQLKAINPDLSADEILIGLYRLYPDTVEIQKVINAVELVMNTDCKGIRTKEWKRDDSYWNAEKKVLSWQARQGFARKYRACKKAGIDLNLTLEENAKKTGVPIRRLKEWNDSLEIGLKSEKEILNEKLEQLIIDNPTLSDRKLSELAKQHGLKAGKDKINTLRKKIVECLKNDGDNIL